MSCGCIKPKPSALNPNLAGQDDPTLPTYHIKLNVGLFGLPPSSETYMRGTDAQLYFDKGFVTLWV
jgi:hypothetical protein